MKGGIAAAIIAMESLLEEGISFPGSLEFSGTVDEETGGYGGVAYLAHQGFFSKPRVDHVIIPEPLNVDRICSDIVVPGGPRLKLMDGLLMARCRFWETVPFVIWGLHTTVGGKLYPELDKKQTKMPVVPEGAKRSTLNLQAVHGGEEESYDGMPSPCVPDSCRMVLDRRFLIEESLEEVKAEVHELLEELVRTRPGFRYSISDIMEFHPTMTESDAPVVKAVEDAIGSV